MANAKDAMKLPRVAMMLRAAYFGQELLSTFGTSIGEIALIPATGGLFTVYLTLQAPGSEAGDDVQAQQVLIWDRKTGGGFPETKILKQLIRDHIEPDKKLGHSDTPSSKLKTDTEPLKGVVETSSTEPIGNAKDCEDSK